MRYGIDPTRPFLLFVGRITRQKGIVHLGARNSIHGPGFSDRALRRRAGYAGDCRGDEGGSERRAGEAGGCDLDRRDGGQGKRCTSSTRTRRSFVVRRFTNRSGSSISKRWRARPRWWRAQSAESRKSWSMARPGFSFPIEQMKESPFEPIEPGEIFARPCGADQSADVGSGATDQVWARRAETSEGEIWLGGDRADRRGRFTIR